MLRTNVPILKDIKVMLLFLNSCPCDLQNQWKLWPATTTDLLICNKMKYTQLNFSCNLQCHVQQTTWMWQLLVIISESMGRPTEAKSYKLNNIYLEQCSSKALNRSFHPGQFHTVYCTQAFVHSNVISPGKQVWNTSLYSPSGGHPWMCFTSPKLATHPGYLKVQLPLGYESVIKS